MDFTIVSWNLNGFRSALGKGLGEFINDHSPDIVCFQEIKCDDLDLMRDACAQLGYIGIASPALKKGYSGTLTAWKKQYEPQVIEKPDIGIDPDFIAEGRVVEICAFGMRIVNLYLPSGSSSEVRQARKFEFMEQFLGYLSSLEKEELANLLILGDFNICHQEIDIHHPVEATKRELSGFLPAEREWFSKMLSCGLSDSYRVLNPDSREYSWWSFRAGARGKNLGWRLDYAIAGSDVMQRVNEIKIMKDVFGSDHCPVKVRLSV